MKAVDFAYARPGTLAEAIGLLAGADRDLALLAGGQSLMPMMNLRMSRPELLIDLNALADLAFVREEGEEIAIGAMTRWSALGRSDIVAAHVPLLALALPYIAHPAIRNRGTVGGSVALADPAAELPAVLLALGGSIRLAGPSGERTVPADDFFLGVYETARAADEVVVAIAVPRAHGRRFGFSELSRRHGDYAMAGCAVAWGEAPRAAFFSVADRAIRAHAAEAALAGRAPDDDGAVDAAVAALAEIQFAGDLNAAPATKRHLAGVVLRRALAGLRP